MINNCPICDHNDFKFYDYLIAPKQEEWEYDCFKGNKLATCNNCEFTFASQVFEEGSLSKFYNTLYSGNELSVFKASENYEFAARSLSHVNFIKANLELKNYLNILEIGPNENGMIPSFSLYCKPNYFYYDQLEFPVINHYGGKRLGKYFSKNEAFQINSNKKMDLIVLSHCLEHFEPQYINQDIEAMSLALKPNGCVSIEVPLQTLFHAPHTQSFRVKNMSMLFEKHGFKIIATQEINSPIGKFRGEVINKSSKPSRFIINQIKNIMSISIPRKIRLMFLKPFYERKLMPLYDGRPYMRVLAQKIHI